MASDGSKGPKPYTQFQASTVFLRVPAGDWVNVKRGNKREFRGSPGAVSGLKFVEPPTPVVCYRVNRAGDYDAALMVLEERWQEDLAAITPESLEREGFKTFDEFRRYWVLREKTRFRPTRRVSVFRVRPWEAGDSRAFADRLLERLYGAFIPTETTEAESQ